MAKIPSYQSQGQIIGPVNQRNATGEDFGAAQGRATQGLGREVVNLGNQINVRQEQREISRLNAEMATAQAEMTVELQEELNNADPNDDAFGERYQQKVQDRLAKIAETAETRGGKLFMEKAGAETSAHFFQNASLGQIQLAGKAAKENYLASVDAMTTMVTNSPANYGFAVQQMETAAMAMPGLTTEAKLTIIREGAQKIAESAAFGEIQQSSTVKDAMAVRDEIKAGKYDENIDGAMKTALIAKAEAQADAIDRDDKLKLAEAEKAKKELNNATSLDIGNKIRSGTATYQDIMTAVSAGDISDDSTQRALFDEMDDYKASLEGGRTKKDDPATYSDFQARLVLPDGDARKLKLSEAEQAFGRGQLSRESYGFFRDEISGKKDPEHKEAMSRFTDFLQGTKTSITDSDPITKRVDAVGDQLFLEYSQRSRAIFMQGLEKGLKPEQLLSPGSPEYIGKLIPQYGRGKTAIRQAMKDYVNGKIGTLPAVVPYGAPNYTELPISAAEGGQRGLDLTRQRSNAPPPLPPEKQAELGNILSGDGDLQQFFAPADAPGIGGGQSSEPWVEAGITKEEYGKLRDRNLTHADILGGAR